MSLSNYHCFPCRGQQSWSTSGIRMTPGPSLFAGPSSCSGPPYWRARCLSEKLIHVQKRVHRQNTMILIRVAHRKLTDAWYFCLCVQKRPMQTDGWPEVDESKQPELHNEQDLLQAKNLILNWIKDLRAQPEVGDVRTHSFL